MNKITIMREFGAMNVRAVAWYSETADGWHCKVQSPNGYNETRGPSQCGNDVWSTLVDMIECALDWERERAA